MTQSGRRWGGKLLARGALYLMLQNRTYVGEIVHKDKHYPGKHDGIIDRDLWERVQARLSENRVERRSGAASRDPSLLAGMLYDDSGERMTPSHAVKRRGAKGSRPDRETNNGKRYRYYVSRSLTMRSRETAPNGRRLPAGEIERLVADRFRMFLSTRAEVQHAIEAFVPEAREQRWIADRAIELSDLWSDLSPAERRGILLVLGTRVEVHPERVDIKLTPQRIPGLLRNQPFDLSPVPETIEHDDRLTLSVPARLRRVGLETRMLIDGLGPGGGKTVPDPSLIRPLVKAHSLRDKIVHGGGQTLAKLAEREGINASYFTRLIRLTFLAPDITRAILEGRQPPDLTAAKLLRDTRLPLDWEEQRTALGFV